MVLENLEQNLYINPITVGILLVAFIVAVISFIVTVYRRKRFNVYAFVTIAIISSIVFIAPAGSILMVINGRQDIGLPHFIGLILVIIAVTKSVRTCYTKDELLNMA